MENTARKHPCPYPEEIPRRLIKLFSFHGETVLDPFVGSGTTAKVSKQLGRNFLGFDLNPNFCELSKSGLKQEYFMFRPEVAICQ
jgi:site-specific DNA-methyltransferase (adenine-specific)